MDKLEDKLARTTKMRNITSIIIHCSASPNTYDIGVKEIDGWHRERGFKKIGYHFVIRRNGTVEFGRAIDEAGAHVSGFNAHSIGICLAGTDVFTDSQMNALRGLVISLCNQFLLPYACVFGHYEFTTSKTCPNFDVKAWREKLGDV